MSESKSELFGVAIVLVGAFDLSVVQPSRMLKAQLIRDSDLTDLAINFYTPELISLHFSWMELIAEKDKVQAVTLIETPLAEPVRDFVIELISEMKTARITGLGVNSHRHFQAKGVDAWHAIGHKLVYKDEFWATVLNAPGTQRVDVRGQRTDGFKGHITVRVEPSLRMQNGVYVEINDHFESPEEEVNANPTALIDRLSNNWSEILKRAELIVQKVQELDNQ